MENEPKVRVLPAVSKSDMEQQVGWRAAKKGMSVEEFKRQQYEKNYERQKQQRQLIKKCPSWHVHKGIKSVVIDGVRFQVNWCKQCKEHKAIKEA